MIISNTVVDAMNETITAIRLCRDCEYGTERRDVLKNEDRIFYFSLRN